MQNCKNRTKNSDQKSPKTWDIKIDFIERGCIFIANIINGYIFNGFIKYRHLYIKIYTI